MRRLFGIGVVTVILATAVAAASEDDRAPITMRAEVYDKLSKAQNAAENQDYDRAFDLLDDVKEMRKLDPYEEAQLYTAYGYTYFCQEQYVECIDAYERVLEQEQLPEVMRTTTLYTLAQLHFQQERYETGISYLDRWLALSANPGPEAYVLLGQGYYQLERYEEAVPPVERAIEVAREREQPVRESWYVLLRALYHELGEPEKLLEVLEILVTRFPSKDYWIHLASTYGEMENHTRQLTAYELAYAQGYLDGSGNELVLFAQLLLRAQVPYRAGIILQQGLDDGLVESSSKHVRLLSQAWILAREDEKAIEALTRAAALSDDGEVDARLAQSYAKLDSWEKSVEAARSALRKGIRDAHQLELMLGMALFELERLDEAKDAFRQALNTSESRATATKWITYIESEERRLQELRASLGGQSSPLPPTASRGF